MSSQPQAPEQAQPGLGEQVEDNSHDTGSTSSTSNDNLNDNDAATTTAEDAVADDTDTGDLPMSMSASVILTNLPKDASHALALVDELDDFKGKPLSKTLLASILLR